MFAGVAFDFCAGGGDGEGFAIGAIGDHGVESVGDGENSGAEGDLFTAQAARVAGAVVTFLVREHDFGGFLEEGNAFENGKADFAMFAHDVALFSGERAGLA